VRAPPARLYPARRAGPDHAVGRVVRAARRIEIKRNIETIIDACTRLRYTILGNREIRKTFTI